MTRLSKITPMKSVLNIWNLKATSLALRRGLPLWAAFSIQGASSLFTSAKISGIIVGVTCTMILMTMEILGKVMKVKCPALTGHFYNNVAKIPLKVTIATMETFNISIVAQISVISQQVSSLNAKFNEVNSV